MDEKEIRRLIKKEVNEVLAAIVVLTLLIAAFTFFLPLEMAMYFSFVLIIAPLSFYLLLDSLLESDE